MKTAAEFELIALWMGWVNCPNVLIDGERVAWWVTKEGYCIGPVAAKTSLTPAEAVEALDRMVERGYMYELWSGTDGTDGQSPIMGCSVCTKARWLDSVHGSIADDPQGLNATAITIPEAVEQAILALVEKEGR